MKRFWQRTILALGLTLMITSAFATAQSYKLRVDGLACPFCAYGVEKKLGAIEGVQRIEVDIASGTVTVTMKEGANLDEAVARKAVKDAGFTLRGFQPAPASSRTN